MCGARGLRRKDDTGVASAQPILSGRLAVMRSGLHLAQIVLRLRDLERVVIALELRNEAGSREARGDRRSRLQALDLTIQELAGLSDILIGAASLLPDRPDARIDGMVELPRLQSLSRALRDRDGEASDPEVVIF